MMVLFIFFCAVDALCMFHIFKGRLHGKINLMRYSPIRQILPCKHC